MPTAFSVWSHFSIRKCSEHSSQGNKSFEIPNHYITNIKPIPGIVASTTSYTILSSEFMKGFWFEELAFVICFMIANFSHVDLLSVALTPRLKVM